jgi:hypothetical protein
MVYCIYYQVVSSYMDHLYRIDPVDFLHATQEA